MKHRFNASVIHIGFFLSLQGLLDVIYQGFLMKYLNPFYLDDNVLVFSCMAMSGLQLFGYGLCTNIYQFFAVMLFFSPASMYAPALKSMVVKVETHILDQGAIQGSLSSLRTMTSAIGALLFPSVFYASFMFSPNILGLPFFLGSTIELIGLISLRSYIHEKNKLDSIYNRYEIQRSLNDIISIPLNDDTAIMTQQITYGCSNFDMDEEENVSRKSNSSILHEMDEQEYGPALLTK
jgi:hypothetical protein